MIDRESPYKIVLVCCPVREFHLFWSGRVRGGEMLVEEPRQDETILINYTWWSPLNGREELWGWVGFLLSFSCKSHIWPWLTRGRDEGEQGGWCHLQEQEQELLTWEWEIISRHEKTLISPTELNINIAASGKFKTIFSFSQVDL